MIGSLEESAVFSTICFSGSTIANAVEKLTKSCDKRASLRTAAGVVKAVNDTKAAQRQLEELQRHNRVMVGRGVYLVPYKCGRGNRVQSHASSALQSEQLRAALYTVSTIG
ncbi:hypothetical protein ALC57_13223 [Trachymyrmex cornetzi]|uniref:Uncharacterized protein n=1 Tax=Trachymyrmex cornetzi TaxID=471704 RepID=A0A151IZS9_9HYME|nr:hypothetical protein ALC57_13223 [Trachymyrmex cornetzi]